ncbi:MAG: flavin reductase family protein [Bacteroidales bacterium]|nr:flavin reductase family protein [Bacteroidales bacterium]
MEENTKKVHWKPGTMVYPLPAAMVSCGNTPEKYNIITIAWTGTTNTEPPMAYVSIRKSRHSHHLIAESGEFVINLTTKELAFATDWCGVKSGRDFDKFKEMKLTAVKGEKVNAPIIAECPINIECKVTQVISQGSHDLFLAEVVHVQATEAMLNPETNKFDFNKSTPIVYSHGAYHELGKFIGKFGFSVMKKKTQKRLKNKKS